MEHIHFTEICVICLDKNSSYIFKPCLHMCICDVCTGNYAKRTDRTCPMCRKSYTSIEFQESPPIVEFKDDEDVILENVLKLSEEEALNEYKLKKAEEQLFSLALHESLQNLKQHPQQALVDNTVIRNNAIDDISRINNSTTYVASNLSCVSRGAIPKTVKFSITQNLEKEKKCLEVYFCFREFARFHFDINLLDLENKRKIRQSIVGTFSLYVPATKLNLDVLRIKASDENFKFILRNPGMTNLNTNGSLVTCSSNNQYNSVNIDSDKVVQKLRDLILKNPQAHYYHLNIINYEISMDQGPLEINVIPIFSSNSLNLQVHYKYWQETFLPYRPLKKVKIIVHVNQPFRFIGMPSPIKIPNSNAMYWYFEEIGHTNGVGSLSIRYDFINKTAPIRGSVRVEYACDDASWDDADLVDVHNYPRLNYLVKGVRQKLIAEEYFVFDETNNGSLS